jgi:hypothetical protein
MPKLNSITLKIFYFTSLRGLIDSAEVASTVSMHIVSDTEEQSRKLVCEYFCDSNDHAKTNSAGNAIDVK